MANLNLKFTKKNANKLDSNFKQNDGVFVLTNHELELLNLSKSEKSLIKPYYTSEQVNLYFTNPINNHWVIYTDSSYKDERSLDSYPTIKNHLDQFQTIITSSNKPYGLHRSRNEKIFKGEKIFATRKSVDRPIFSYSDSDSYVSQTFNVIKTERFNYKYLVAVLNSNLIKFWLKHRGKLQGNNFQLDRDPLLGVPIKTHAKYESQIIKLVDQIINALSEERYNEIVDLEKQIDEYVYEIYQLTREEINIIKEI